MNQVPNIYQSSLTSFQRLAATNTSTGPRTPELMGERQSEPIMDNSQVLFSNGTTDFPDWNLDDWMLYNDVLWQPALSGADLVSQDVYTDQDDA